MVAGPGLKPVVLVQNPALAEYLENAPDLVDKLEKDGFYQNGGWRVMRRSTAVYQKGRVVYDCLALKISGGSPTNRS